MTITRALQYEVLESLPLNGEVLDFGGGEKSQYRNNIVCTSYRSVNIDPGLEPTWVVKVGGGLPCSAGTFDTVLSMNTLEHVFDVQFVLNELYRVLRPGGELLLSVPFLYPIHAHPDDYFRPTPSWYRAALASVGFGEVEVIPMSWGPFSTGIICSGAVGPLKAMRKQTALLFDLLYSDLTRRLYSSAAVAAYLERFATAFFVRAVK